MIFRLFPQTKKLSFFIPISSYRWVLSAPADLFRNEFSKIYSSEDMSGDTADSEVQARRLLRLRGAYASQTSLVSYLLGSRVCRVHQIFCLPSLTSVTNNVPHPFFPTIIICPSSPPTLFLQRLYISTFGMSTYLVSLPSYSYYRPRGQKTQFTDQNTTTTTIMPPAGKPKRTHSRPYQPPQIRPQTRQHGQTA